MHVLNPAIRLRASQIEMLGSVLAGVFHNDPAAEYILPDAPMRRSVLSWFFSSVAIRTSRLCGEIYTTVNVDGGALWIRPGVDLTITHALRTELGSLPFRVDRASIKRWINVSQYLESVRRHLADKQHWYLIALGTEPSGKERATREELLAPVLAMADWDIQACYVETFHAKELAFYKEHGFQIAGAGQIPHGGPSFWSLIRPPCAGTNEQGTSVHLQN